jgi:2-hydroxyacyl-CoA lyase 1
LKNLPRSIRDSYRLAFYGKPGVGFGDLLADYMQGVPREVVQIEWVEEWPRVLGEEGNGGGGGVEEGGEVVACY